MRTGLDGDPNPRGESESVLSLRLQAVADQIRGPRHADIGTDHALLPLHLLKHGLVKHVVAIEKNAGPFELARRALLDWPAEVRRGDGLDPLRAGEVDSLSITGMGALNIVEILQAHPQKLPARLVLQSMDESEPLRRWAYNGGFHLSDEHWVASYQVLTLLAAPAPDPAYLAVPLRAALRFGPHLLRRGDPKLTRHLARRQRWTDELARRCPRPDILERQQILNEAVDFIDERWSGPGSECGR